MPTSNEWSLEIVEEFTNLLRLGESGSLSEFVQRHPHLADELRGILSAVALVEQVALVQDAQPQPAPLARELDPMPRQLGDFRLVCEIGRGGMGVVYEAEQLSLKRRVAIKVLSDLRFDNPVYRQRFAREAHAAGQLHHTNIVPVIAFGSDSRLAYYAMPLIDGQSLDIVIREVKHLEANELAARQSRDHALRIPDSEELPEDANRELATHLAQGLLTGRLELLSDKTVAIADVNTTSEGASPQAVARWDRAAEPHGVQRSDTYYRNVVRIIIQAADALQYAHDKGYMHRDIKPSNLMLDRRGVIWITDFGLTKNDEHTALTKSDDLLGTLRYMAPERFSGIANAQSDVYALGLTLYELLSLQCAYDARDRSQLIKQVSNAHPLRLQTLVPDLHADLVTITHKAIAPILRDRYTSAAQMADDLRRFLLDEPIRARPETVFRKSTRWCRKNPIVASLSLFLIVAVLCLMVVQRQVRVERDNYRDSLVDALVSQAQFQRLTGQAGQRVKSIQSIAAAASNGGRRSLDEELIRSLVLMDLDPLSRWPAGHSSFAVDRAAFSPDHQQNAAFTASTVQVREVPSAGSSPGRLLWEAVRPAGTPHAAKFSPDGQMLAANLDDGQRGKRLCLWQWQLGAKVIEIKGVAERAFDVDRGGKWLACGVQEGNQWYLRVTRLHDNKVVVQTLLPGMPFDIRFEPHGSRVAIPIPSAEAVLIYDASNGNHLHAMNYGEDVYAVAWSPTAEILAVGLGFDVELASIGNPAEPLVVLQGHTWMVHAIAFHPSGNLLASHSLREGTTRLWDLRRRRQVLTASGHSLSFDSSGQTLAMCHGDMLSLQKICDERVYGVWAATATQQPSVWRTLLHPTLPLLVTCGSNGIHCWDLVTGGLIASSNEGNTYTICWDVTSADLLSAGESGLRRRQLHRDAIGNTTFSEASKLDFGRGDPAIPSGSAYALHTNRDGAVWVAAFHQGQHLYVWDKQANAVRQLACGEKMAFVAISPDGRWVSGGNFEQPGFRVWDLQNEGEMHPLDAPGSAAQVFFSPNGQFLVACSNDRYTLFDVPTWQKRFEIMTEQTVEGAAAFSADSQTLAICRGHGDVRLIHPLDGRQQLRLDGNLDQLNVLNLHFGSGESAQQLYLACGPAGVRRWDLEAVQQLLAAHRLAP